LGPALNDKTVYIEPSSLVLLNEEYEGFALAFLSVMTEPKGLSPAEDCLKN
jgi:hypothetical protein